MSNLYQDDKCWQCGRPFRRGKPALVQMLTEDQLVYVGPDCAKKIEATGMLECAKGHFVPAAVVADAEEGRRLRDAYRSAVEENPYRKAHPRSSIKIGTFDDLAPEISALMARAAKEEFYPEIDGTGYYVNFFILPDGRVWRLYNSFTHETYVHEARLYDLEHTEARAKLLPQLANQDVTVETLLTLGWLRGVVTEDAVYVEHHPEQGLALLADLLGRVLNAGGNPNFELVTDAQDSKGRHIVTYKGTIQNFLGEAAPSMRARQLLGRGGAQDVWEEGFSVYNPGVEENPYKPNLDIQALAGRYAAAAGLPPIQETPYVRVDPAVGREIARVFAALPNAPDDEWVRYAYDALSRELAGQWALARQFVEVIPYGTDDPNPYPDSPAMMEDIFRHRRLRVFAGGEEHALWTREQNFRFRAVHDFFGHAAKGFAFGPRGEENAWIEHSKMFTPLARWALTSETRGQNSFVNFGPFAHLPPERRPYAEQKVLLLPVEFVLQPVFEEAYASWPAFQSAALYRLGQVPVPEIAARSVGRR